MLLDNNLKIGYMSTIVDWLDMKLDTCKWIYMCKCILHTSPQCKMSFQTDTLLSNNGLIYLFIWVKFNVQSVRGKGKLSNVIVMERKITSLCGGSTLISSSIDTAEVWFDSLYTARSTGLRSRLPALVLNKFGLFEHVTEQFCRQCTQPHRWVS